MKGRNQVVVNGATLQEMAQEYFDKRAYGKADLITASNLPSGTAVTAITFVVEERVDPSHEAGATK